MTGFFVAELEAVIQQLELDWQRAEDGWRDEVSREFEHRRLRPLLLRARTTARDLRPEDGLRLTGAGLTARRTEPTASEQLSTILRDGPDLGVHTLIWCDSVPHLDQLLDRRTKQELGLVVALQMDPADSSNLLNSPAASRLGRHRALFQDEEAGRLEKFRPYTLPGDDWLVWVGEQLRDRFAGDQPRAPT